jgi:serine/threonine-protein kinase Chk1
MKSDHCPLYRLQLNSTGAYHAEPVDIWGAGVVLFTLLAGSEFEVYHNSSHVSLSIVDADTPWDEPSTSSPEYRAYISGELLQYEPWSNIPQDALCKVSCSVRL